VKSKQHFLNPLYAHCFTAYGLLVLVHVNVFGVDDVVVAAAAAARLPRRPPPADAPAAEACSPPPASPPACAGLLVERFGEFVRSGLQVVEGVVHALRAALFESLLRVGERGFELRRRSASSFSLFSLKVFST
jgi:hypothetical protein